MAAPSAARAQLVPGLPSTARLHVVTGKGGTGKTTVAASMALALATGGRKVLLVEVEGRQALAQLFDVPALPYEERRLASTPGNGSLWGLAIDAEQAMIEYLDMFYGLKRSARGLKKMGAVDFVTTLAPGLRDVLLTGKVKEAVTRTGDDGHHAYDAVVLDAPPTGRITKFLDATQEVANLTKFGPINRQSEGVITLLHSPKTAVHLVTLLEEMPVQETIDAAAELRAARFHLGAVVVNRARPPLVTQNQLGPDNAVDTKLLATGLRKANVPVALAASLAAQVAEYADRLDLQAENQSHLAVLDLPVIELPDLNPPVELGELNELARCFTIGGSRWKRLDLGALVRDPATKVIVTCGSGGVGKTTTAAAMAMLGAEAGRRTVVLTIDPARRLAQSMGLTELDNTPRAVVGVKGDLHAMMLDMKRTFDDVVLEHSSPERAEQIFANPFYQSLSSSFAGTQEYMAMEKLGQLVAANEWDLIVVDTPPSRSALDFLDAPNRLGRFLDGRMIRVLTAPARAGGRTGLKVMTAGIGIFARVFSRVLGGDLIRDLSSFVSALESMFGGFRERAQHTYELLKTPGTAFVVVAAPEPDALREASYFVDRLSSEHMPLAGIVVNRMRRTAAEQLSSARAEAAADALAAKPRDPAVELAEAALRVHAETASAAAHDARMAKRFSSAHPDVALVSVPALPADVHDLDGLRQIGELLDHPAG